MAFDVFAIRPWLIDQQDVADLPMGMLGRTEGALLHALARDVYKGYGEIVDLGAFLGASAFCLTKGLAANDRIRHKPGRVHSFDLFRVWQEQGETVEYMADQLMRHFGVPVGDDESTLHVFTANLGDLARLVRTHVGDVTKARWSGRPIEILFVDIAKTLPIWKHVLREFYPSLIPGVSILVHQDFHHPLLPWVHVAQQHLAPFFEIIEPHADDSVAFRLIERIPDRVIDEVSQFEFSLSEQLSLLDRAIHQFGSDGDHIFLAKAVLLGREGLFSEADAIVGDVTKRLPMSHDPKLGFSTFLTKKVLTREKGSRIVSKRDFDERNYLDVHADVDAAVRSGHFNSGYDHWLKNGRQEGREL